MKITDKITITNEDNMIMMSRYPDKYFELAIVDPPYGSDNIKGGYTSGKGGGISSQNNYHNELWNQDAPSSYYFDELNRVCENLIIWGANHFFTAICASNIKNINSPCWIVWDKDNGNNSFADSELAFTTFNTAVRNFKFRWQGMLQQDMKNKEIRIHPTQKPVALYKWLLDKYAKPGDKILDTHLGSGSIAIACHDYDFNLTACELDKDYYDKAIYRIKQHTNQLQLF